MFDATMFDFDRDSLTFIAEASTLTLGGRKPLLHEIREDFCTDLGFMLKGKKSSVCYVLAKVKMHEDEILSWTLEPTVKSVRQVPAAAGTKIVIFND